MKKLEKLISLKKIALALIILVIGSLAFDYYKNSAIKVYPNWPPHNARYQEEKIYSDLVTGNLPIDWNRLTTTLQNMDDFRTPGVLQILYGFGDQLPDSVRKAIDASLLSFRYWMDEPGGNSMCYWSENHQILYAMSEYLAGQHYPDRIFSNSGLTGKEHMQKASKRILDWLGMRWKYGFAEFYSNVYYKEDISALVNLIEYAEDRNIVEKSKIVLDLLFYDVASQSIKNVFSSVSGRAYEHTRKGGSVNNLDGVTDYFWGNGAPIRPGKTYGLMVSNKYKLPAVFTEIAKDTSNVVIRQCNGLDLSQLKEEGYEGSGEESIQMQFGMEAFTNPGIVRNTMAYVRKNGLFTNLALKDLRMLNYTVIHLLHLEPIIIWLIDPYSNGVAIQQGNSYTYKTRDYSLFALQNHQPGGYADQQYAAGMSIGNAFSIFHTHPAQWEDGKQKTPGYWVGYGRFPLVAQDSTVNLAIYNLPDHKNLSEKELLNFTHAWFPAGKFDSVQVVRNYAFGKKGDAYCALVGRNPLHYKSGSTDDLIQEGKQTCWIIEAGSHDKDGTFENFIRRILKNKVSFDSEKLALIYQSNGKEYQLNWESGFSINQQIINTKYKRFDSPYIQAEKKAGELKFQMNGKFLYLNFDQNKREFN